MSHMSYVIYHIIYHISYIIYHISYIIYHIYIYIIYRISLSLRWIIHRMHHRSFFVSFQIMPYHNKPSHHFWWGVAPCSPWTTIYPMILRIIQSSPPSRTQIKQKNENLVPQCSQKNNFTSLTSLQEDHYFFLNRSLLWCLLFHIHPYSTKAITASAYLPLNGARPEATLVLGGCILTSL